MRHRCGARQRLTLECSAFLKRRPVLLSAAPDGVSQPLKSITLFAPMLWLIAYAMCSCLLNSILIYRLRCSVIDLESLTKHNTDRIRSLENSRSTDKTASH